MEGQHQDKAATSTADGVKGNITIPADEVSQENQQDVAIMKESSTKVDATTQEEKLKLTTEPNIINHDAEFQENFQELQKQSEPEISLEDIHDAVPYDVRNLRKPLSIYEIQAQPNEMVKLVDYVGCDTRRKDNYHLMDDNTLCYVVGNAAVFENLTTREREYILGLDEGGVSTMTIHPSKEYFAVAGKGHRPRVFIYTFPGKEIIKILEDGAERGYSALNFNSTGTKLATVAQAPDYLLTVWNWMTESISLHCKAFGQDVTMVKFSRDDDRRLTTSGTGHIRFWKMATTFTGLKLQGYTGKFGKVDLSDVAAFIELPDGKVVSGSETGALLLWEGNFIKCRFTRHDSNSPRSELSPRSRYAAMKSPRSQKMLPHCGEVTYLDHDREENCIISAGMDGFIRWWDFGAIDTAEVDSDISMDYELVPRAEFFLGARRGIVSMVDSGILNGVRSFIIQDGLGNLSIVKFDTGLSMKLVQAVEEKTSPNIKHLRAFHCDEITGIAVNPSQASSYIATIGRDGIKLFDYRTHKTLSSRSFSSSPTYITWLDSNLEGPCIAVGYENGVVRMFSAKKGFLSLVLVVKPHNAAITSISLSGSTNLMTTSAKDGEVWFFHCEMFKDYATFDGLRFIVPVPAPEVSSNKFSAYVTSSSWDPSGHFILLTCSDGILREVDASGLINSMDTIVKEECETYFTELPVRECMVKRPLPVIVEENGDNEEGNGTKTALGSPKKMPKSPSKSPGPSVSPSKSLMDKSSSIDDITREDISNLDAIDAKKCDEEENDLKVDAQYRTELFPMSVKTAEYSRYPILAGGHRRIYATCELDDEAVVCQYTIDDDGSFVELKTGLHADAATGCLDAPAMSVINYSVSGNYLLMGGVDGSVVIRPTQEIQTFMRVVAHTGVIKAAALSADDHFLFTAGADGMLCVHSLLPRDVIESVASTLWLDIDAGVFQDMHGIKPIKQIGGVDDARQMEEDIKDMFIIKGGPSAAMTTHPTIYEEGLEPHPDEVADISETEYSIEDKKQKLSHEMLLAEAEKKKEVVRAKVRQLREDFEKVRKIMNEIPEEARLTDEEMIVDPEYMAMLKAEGEEKLKEVRLKCAYEREKAAKLKEKLYSRLMDGCLVEKMPLSDLRYPHTPANYPWSKLRCTVFSIPTRGLDPSAAELLDDLRKEEKSNEINKAKHAAAIAIEENAQSKVDGVSKKVKSDGVYDLQGAMNGGPRKGAAQHQRKEMRTYRKGILSEHLAVKPDENEDDVRDLKAIEQAKATIGNHVAKSSSDYKISPENEMNVKKKKKQMVLLEESLITMKLRFNEKFLALRLIKKDVVMSVKAQNQRIRQIDVELGQPELSSDLWEPKLDPAEFPDDREEVTEAELEAYRRSKESTSWLKSIAPRNSICTGTKTVINVNPITGDYDVVKKNIEGFVAVESVEDLNDKVTSIEGANSQEIEDMKKVYQDKKHYEVDDRLLTPFILPHDRNESSRRQLDMLENALPAFKVAKQAYKTMIATSSKYKNPPLIIKEKIAQREKKLRQEREQLLTNISNSVNSFREALENLRKLRHETTVDIKQVELKLILYVNEYKILQSFEEKDVAIRSRRSKAMKDKSDIEQQLIDLNESLQEKKMTCEKCKQNLRETEERKRELIPEDAQYAVSLQQIYRKKVKMNGQEDEYDEDSEEEEEDVDEEEEDLDNVEDICPPGCPDDVYESVLQLRAARVQMEMDDKSAMKQLDDVKRTMDRATLKDKQFDKELTSLDSEIYQLQLTKQAALNEVPVFIPLSASQIYPFKESGALSGPDGSQTEEDKANVTALLDANCRQIVDDMTMGGKGSFVLMSKDDVERLQSRVGELRNEIDEAKRGLKELQKRKGTVEKKLRDDAKALEAKRQKVLQLQMMKFGAEVDIDDLEKKLDKTSEEEISRQIEEIEKNFRKEQSKLMKQHDKLTDKLVKLTKTNTALMKELGDLTKAKMDIERELNHVPPVTTGDAKLAELQDQKEMRKMTIFLEQTEREMEMVRNEIAMLKRKDRQHVLPHIPEKPTLRSTTAPGRARRLSGGLGAQNLPHMDNGVVQTQQQSLDKERVEVKDKENEGVNRRQRPKSSVARSAIPVQSF